MLLDTAPAVRWLSAVQNLIYPPTCLLCDSFLGLSAVAVVCPVCRAGLPLRTETPSADPELEGVLALYGYGRSARKLVHRIKITGDPRASVWLGAELNRCGDERLRGFGGFDAVIPVPSHKKTRLISFGAETPSLWAQELSKVFQAPIRHALVRNRTIPKQTSLTRAERLRSSEESLSLRTAPLAGCRSVLLADDVMTTGATARACARKLRAHGIPRVSLAVVARG